MSKGTKSGLQFDLVAIPPPSPPRDVFSLAPKHSHYQIINITSLLFSFVSLSGPKNSSSGSLPARAPKAI